MTDNTSDQQASEQPQTDSKKKEGFSDVLEHLAQAASIATALGEERFSQFVSELRAQTGKASQKGEEIGRKARERVEQQKKSFEEWLTERFAAAMARQNVATKEDIARLEKLILEIGQHK